jgi:hypothetical protein
MSSKILTIASLSLAFASAVPAADTAARPAAATLVAPKGAAQSVDARGFIHRWLVLEPLPVPGRLTESAVQEAVKAGALPGDGLPRDGEELTLANTQVKWHALETLNYNVNLYHFAWALSRCVQSMLTFLRIVSVSSLAMARSTESPITFTAASLTPSAS